MIIRVTVPFKKAFSVETEDALRAMFCILDYLDRQGELDGHTSIELHAEQQSQANT